MASQNHGDWAENAYKGVEGVRRKGSQVVRTIGRLHTMVKFLRKVAFVTRQVFWHGMVHAGHDESTSTTPRTKPNSRRRRQDIPTKRRKLRREVGLDETRRPCNMPTRRQSQRVRSTGRSSTAAWDCVSRARPLGGTARVRSRTNDNPTAATTPVNKLALTVSRIIFCSSKYMFVV